MKGEINSSCLKALHAVAGCDDLTTAERFALVAIWLKQQRQPRKIGPTLLARYLGTSAGSAKQILWRLRRKGYIWTAGGGGRGKVAVRTITAKSRMPKTIETVNRVDSKGKKPGDKTVNKPTQKPSTSVDPDILTGCPAASIAGLAAGVEEELNCGPRLTVEQLTGKAVPNV